MGRPLPEETEKQARNEAPASLWRKTTSQNIGNMTARLLSPLLLLTRIRLFPHEEREKEKARITYDEFDDDSEEEEENMNQSRFEVLPTKGIEEDYNKRAYAAEKSGKVPSSEKQTRMTADNYRQMYLDQREQEIDRAEMPAKEKPQQPQGPSDAEIAERKRIDDQRFRARELQNKIAWWKSQQGLGQYDESTIGLNVDILQRELGNIPPGLW